MLTLDALGRIDEDPVEIEQDRIAFEVAHDRYRRRPMIVPNVVEV